MSVGLQAGVAPARAVRARAALPSLLVLLGIALFLLAHADALLNDPDSQWHVAVGRWIVAHRALPMVDPFSHSFAGAPWIAKEWLSQLLLYGAHALAGWRGPVLVTALVVAGSLAGLHLWLCRRLNGTASLAIVLVAFLVLGPHILARPHVAAFPLLVAWTAGLVAARERGGAPRWRLLAVMVLWGNLHASFPLALAVAGIVGIEAVLDGPRTGWRARAGDWGSFLAVATAAACIGPYGVRPLVLAFGLVGGGEMQRHVAEWQPLALDLPGCLALGVIAGAAAVLAPEWRRNLARLAIALLLGAMTVRHSRFAEVFVLVVPLLCVGPALRRWPGLASSPHTPSPHAPSPRAAPAWTLPALGLAALCLAAASADPRPNPRVTPIEALAAARAAGLDGPVYNDTDFGGFLIASGVPTFVDGRNDQLFLGGFMDGLYAAAGRPDGAAFAALMRRHRIAWALVRPQGDDARQLNRLAGWTLLHRDAVAALYAPTRPAP